MKAPICILLLAFAVLRAPAGNAQTVYKCPGPKGTTMYSQRPCSDDPSKVEEIQVRAVPPPSGVDTTHLDTMKAQTERSRIAYAESNCAASAANDIHKRSEARVAGMQSQINALNRQIGYTNNNLAGATMEAGLRDQIGQLQSAQATERASADQLTAAASARCADQRFREEESLAAREEDAREDKATEHPPASSKEE